MTQVDFSSAVDALRAGGIVAYPTEAVYGLGCDPGNEEALAKVISLKGRDNDKGLIIIAADYAQLVPFLDTPDGTFRKKILAHLDTPTTWVVDAAPTISVMLTGGRNTIAVRVSQHPVAARLCREFGGAITSTSANLSGCEPARTADEVQEQFPAGIDTIIDAPVGTLSQPTRIIDARTGEVLR